MRGRSGVHTFKPQHDTEPRSKLVREPCTDLDQRASTKILEAFINTIRTFPSHHIVHGVPVSDNQNDGKFNVCTKQSSRSVEGVLEEY